MITLLAAADITEKRVCTLHGPTAIKVRAWLAECRAAGLHLYVYEGYRTKERQKELYAQGRTKPGRKVTNAGPGQSMHQYRLAIDFVPLIPHEKTAGMFEAGWDSERLYAIAHAAARKHGLRKISWETPHLEDADFADWKAAQKQFGTACK